ncbi:hypothetical protein JTB14_004827 [Gonioctena quinquepunctata]|nr:hypothetical protein JTB14_004827 [Gonioctena quinquepunctata]
MKGFLGLRNRPLTTAKLIEAIEKPDEDDLVSDGIVILPPSDGGESAEDSGDEECSDPNRESQVIVLSCDKGRNFSVNEGCLNEYIESYPHASILNLDVTTTKGVSSARNEKNVFDGNLNPLNTFQKPEKMSS